MNDLSQKRCQESAPNRSKSIKNRFKFDNWRLSASKGRPKHVLDRFFTIFFNFWIPQGLPKWNQNRSKSHKIAPKKMLKKQTFSDTRFYRFFRILTSRNGVKIEPFFELLRKPRYSENRCFSSVKLMILGVGPSKN